MVAGLIDKEQDSFGMVLKWRLCYSINELDETLLLAKEALNYVFTSFSARPPPTCHRHRLGYTCFGVLPQFLERRRWGAA